MNKQFTQAIMKREGDKIVFIASDETLDRQGEVVSFDSWDLTNFKKNPVLLVDHEYKVENIVGTARNLKKDGAIRAVTFEPNFHEITQLSKDVKRMVDEGSLSKVSVGYMQRPPKKDGDKIVNELLEISFVAVPANPNAGMMLSAEQLACVKSFVDESIEKEGRVLSKKTRGMMVEAVGAMQKAIDTLGELISTNDQIEPEKSIKKDIENNTENTDNTVVEEDTDIPEKEDDNVVDGGDKPEELTEPSNEKPDEVDGKEPEQLSDNDTAQKALKSIAREVNDVLRKMNKNIIS